MEEVHRQGEEEEEGRGRGSGGGKGGELTSSPMRAIRLRSLEEGWAVVMIGLCVGRRGGGKLSVNNKRQYIATTGCLQLLYKARDCCSIYTLTLA